MIWWYLGPRKPQIGSVEECTYSAETKKTMNAAIASAMTNAITSSFFEITAIYLFPAMPVTRVEQILV